MSQQLHPIFCLSDDSQWDVFDRVPSDQLEIVRSSSRGLRARVDAYITARIPSALRTRLQEQQSESAKTSGLFGWFRERAVNKDEKPIKVPYPLWKWGGISRVTSVPTGQLTGAFTFISCTNEQGYRFACPTALEGYFWQKEELHVAFLDEKGEPAPDIPTLTFGPRGPFRVSPLARGVVTLRAAKGTVWSPGPLGALPAESGWLLPAKLAGDNIAIGCGTELRIYSKATAYREYLNVCVKRDPIIGYIALASGLVALRVQGTADSSNHSQPTYLASFLPNGDNRFLGRSILLGQATPTAISESGTDEVSLLFPQLGKYVVWNPSSKTAEQRQLPPQTNSALFLSNGRTLFGTLGGRVTGNSLDIHLGPAVNDMVEIGPELIACALSNGTIALVTTASTPPSDVMLPMKKGAAAFKHPVVGMLKLSDRGLFGGPQGVDHLMLATDNILVSGSIEFKEIYQWYLGQYARQGESCLSVDQRRARHFGCLLSDTEERRKQVAAEAAQQRELKREPWVPSKFR